MANVTFDEDDGQGQRKSVRAERIMESENPKGMAGFVIRKHWAKNKREADIILLSIAVGCLALAAFIFYRNLASPTDIPNLQNTPYEQV